MIKKIPFIAMLLCIAFSSCKKSELLAPQTSELIEISYEGSESTPESKVSYTDDGATAYSFSWHADDKVSLIVADNNTENANLEFTAGKAGKNTDFEGSVSTWSGLKNVYSVYPYNGTTAYVITGENEHTTATVNLTTDGQVIKLRDANKYENSRMLAAVTGATAANATTYSIPKLSYKQVMSIVKFNITEVPEGEKITEMGLKDGVVEFISAADVVLSTAVVTGTPTKANKIFATVEGATTGVTTELNFAIFPIDLSAKSFTIYIKTTDGSGANEKTYEIVKTGINFHRNTIYTTPVSLAGVIPIKSADVVVDGTEKLADKGISTDVAHLVISGDKELNDDDFAWMKTNLSSTLINLDMGKSATKAIPERQFASNITIKQIILPEGLTTIGVEAFKESGLTSIIIPSSVTNYGMGTFSFCTSLLSVTLSEGLTTIGVGAFQQSGLTELTLPASMDNIEDNAFFGCASLETVNSKNLTPPTLTDDIFEGCVALMRILVPSDPASVVDAYKIATGWSMHSEIISGGIVVNAGETLASKSIPTDITHLTISGDKELDAADFSHISTLTALISLDMGKSATKTIPERQFASNTTIKQVILPERLTTIGASAFQGSGLTSVTIPKSIKTWQLDNTDSDFRSNQAFAGCADLTSVTLTEGLTTIGMAAFKNSGLISVIIPKSITDWEMDEHGKNGAFAYCTKLTNVTFPEELTIIGTDAFRNSGLTSVIIPSTVEILGPGAFSGCAELATITGSHDFVFENNVLYNRNKTSLKLYLMSNTQASYTILRSVIRIEERAFAYCTDLKNITLREGLERIGGSAFEESGLTSITIPLTIEGIGDHAFSNCNALTKVTLLNPIPPYINWDVFDDSPLTEGILVPSTGTAVADYKAAFNWIKYEAKISAMP